MPIDTKILEEIRNNGSSLMSLNLRYTQIGDDDVHGLAEALKGNTTFSTINLECNTIGNEGVKALADALKHNNTLATLSLGYNKISDDGAQALADALQHNTTLTSLNLNDNTIGGLGVRGLADALKCNTTLTTLNLGNIPIDVSAAEALAIALKENATLVNLDIRRSNINDQGVKIFAEALKVNTALANLNLSNNQIGFEGVKALAEALKVNVTLSFLELSFNQILNEGVEALKVALKQNITLKTLHLARISKSSFAIIDKFESIHRNENISFVLKDCIKAAWVKPIPMYSYEDHLGVVSKINKIFNNSSEASESFDALIDSMFALRLANEESEALLTDAVVEKIKAYIGSVGLDFEKLPEKSYPKEFVRLLAGKVNAKNAADAESQVMALAGLTQPFHDKELREEGATLLIGLLNNDCFASLSKGSTQRRWLDLLTLEIGCQYSTQRDLMCFALSSYARLCGEAMPRGDELFHKLNQSDFAVANFEELLTRECECNGWSREMLIKKCIEVLMREFAPTPPRSPSPNPHGLFQPFVASESPVAEVISPQNK